METMHTGIWYMFPSNPSASHTERGRGERVGASGADLPPKPFMVREGEWLDLVVIFSSDSVLMEFLLERRDGPPAGETAQ